MKSAPESLPNDVFELKRIIMAQARLAGEQQKIAEKNTRNVEQLREQTSALNLKIQELEDTIEKQKTQYAELQRLVFGPKSEKRHHENPGQALLFNEAETVVDTPQKAPERVKVPAHDRKKSGRKPFPANLERIENVHTLSDEERTCSICGTLRQEIGETRTEELRLIPAKAVVDVHVMKKYGPCGCKDCASPIIQAVGPAKIVPGSRFSNSTIAFFLTSKYVDAQPFYRMEGILSRWGIDTVRSTLCGIAVNVGRAIGDLVEGIRDDILRSPVIGMDETSVQVLHETNRSATTKSYMWVASGFMEGKRLIFYHYHQTRGAEVAKKFLSGYVGYLQTDGYAGYDAVGESPGIIHVGCMAHIRRKFFDADKAVPEPSQAAAFLAMVTEFYRDEHTLRKQYLEGTLNDTAFLDERKKLQGPVLKAMHEWLLQRSMSVTPSSSLGKAISYALGQWDRVVNYLGHGLLSPDNNGLENSIRPFVIGRKNWIFSGTPSGAHASAGLYSLIETAKASGHEPYRYLCYLFDRLPKAKTKEERLALLPYRIDPSSY
jgi:transposase